MSVKNRFGGDFIRDITGNETRREKFKVPKAKESPKGSPHPSLAVRNDTPPERIIHPLQPNRRNRVGVEEFVNSVW